MSTLFHDAHYAIDGFSTYFRLPFPIIRLTIKHWQNPMDVRREIREMEPLRNANLPWDMTYATEHTETLPNALFSVSQVGPTEVMHYQYLNRGSIVRSNGKSFLISTLDITGF